MHRGLLLAAVAALLAFAIGTPALAEEAQGVNEYCTDSGATAYQYDCDGPISPDCAPDRQYADDGTGGCIVDPYQYGDCTGDAICVDAQAEDSQPESGIGALPPASVQNVVVAAAKSASEDASEASRALDAAEPLETTDNVALADEGGPVAETPAYPSGTSQEAATGGMTPQPVAPSDTAAVPAEPAEAAQPTEAVQSTKAMQPTETAEAAEAVDTSEKRGPEEDGEPAAPDRDATLDQLVDKDASFDQVADRDTSFDQVLIPLLALGGITLLIGGGGLLVRRVVG